jgi:hypothetical protein
MSRILASIGVVTLMVGAVACGGGGSSPTGPTSVAPAPTATPVPTSAPVASYNVAGTWHSEARAWNIRLKQNGATITGTLTGFKREVYPDLTNPDLQITGTLTSTGQVKFSCKWADLEFDGTISADNARMDGRLWDCANGCRYYGEILVKQ